MPRLAVFCRTNKYELFIRMANQAGPSLSAVGLVGHSCFAAVGRTAISAVAGRGRLGRGTARAADWAANLDVAFGSSLTAAEKRAILRESFFTFALMLLDIFWFSKDMERRVARWVVQDDSMEPLWQRRATVGITAHLGNWELLGQTVAMRGYPLASVVAPLANPAVDELFQRVRGKSGQDVVPKQGAVRQLLRALREGGKIAILLDQNTLPSEGGVFVPFFGLPVPVSAAGALLGLKTSALFFFGFCLAQPDGRYRCISTGSFMPPAGHDPAAVEQLTMRIAAELEQVVRAHPGQWLWSYKRWKYVTPGADRARYPFYAKPLPEI